MYKFLLWANVICAMLNIGVFVVQGNPVNLLIGAANTFVAAFMWEGN